MAGRPLVRQTAHTQIGNLNNRVDALERNIRGGGFYEIKIFADDQVVTAGDNKFVFAVPGDLDGARLRYCNAFVTTASSGIMEIMIRKAPAFDMLIIPITIDSGELDAENAADPPVIDLTYTEGNPPGAGAYERNNTVYYRDQICIDVDDPGSGAMGLGVQLGFS